MHRPKTAGSAHLAPDRPTTTLDALLAAFDRCETAAERARMGPRLAALGAIDPRIRGALARMLEDDPTSGATCLSALGDPAAVADLSAALDRLLDDPIADCVVCEAQDLSAVVGTLRVLGGKPSGRQLRLVEGVMARAAEAWKPLGDGGAIRRPARGPGRNDPCPCGSGKKYKHCHLGSDGGEPIH